MNRIEGTSASEQISGTKGNDVIIGGAGDDVITGGAGNDLLFGGAGQDTFVFTPGHGNDAIWSFEAGEDLIDLTKFNVEITWDALKENFSTGYNFLFGDFVEIDLREWGGGIIQVFGINSINKMTEDMFKLGPPSLDLTGTNGSDTLVGKAGDDKISGGAGDDVLIGGAGDDLLLGESGNDTFVFEPGHGNDNIWRFEAGKDQIDLSKFGIEVRWDTLKDNFTSGYDPTVGSGNTLDGYFVKIDLTEFGGGTIMVWGVDSIDKLTKESFIFRDSPLNISGTAGADTLVGNIGDDTISGGAGNDVLIGGAGDDQIKGGTGDDIITGGSGDDFLSGESGSDTFVFEPGHGDDHIWRFEAGSDKIDLSKFGIAVEWDTLKDNISSGYDHMYGSVNAMDGNFVKIDLTEFGGGTIVVWGVDSIDKLTEETFILPGTPLNLTGTDGADTLDGNAGGDTISGGAGNDHLNGYEGADKIIGGTGDDVINGGAGDDVLWGGAGKDVFVFEPGQGNDAIWEFEAGQDIIDLTKFNDKITWDELKDNFSKFNNPLFGQYVEIDLSEWGGGKIELWGINSINKITEDMFLLPTGSVKFTGTENNDYQDGGAQDDILSGGAGNDYLAGWQGDDKISGGSGDDIIYGGQGDDIITAGTGDDTLYGDGFLTDEHYSHNGVHTGETDKDIFVFSPGGGKDTIKDFNDGEDLIDLTDFTDISGFTDIKAKQDGSNLIIQFSSDNSITLSNFDLSDLDASDFIFHDASVDGI